jgi:hypothetical protein
MLDYTTFRIAQQEYAELGRLQSVVEGTRVTETGPLRCGLVRLGGLLVMVGRRLQGAAGQRMQGAEGPVHARPAAPH